MKKGKIPRDTTKTKQDRRKNTPYNETPMKGFLMDPKTKLNEKIENFTAKLKADNADGEETSTETKSARKRLAAIAGLTAAGTAAVILLWKISANMNVDEDETDEEETYETE